MRRPAVLVGTCLVALVTSLPGLAATHEDEDRLKAHYLGKIVTAKIDLPRTDGGFVFIHDCEIDTEALRRAIQGTSSLGVETGGVGVANGATVVVGDVKVRKNYVQFLLGTSRSAEWMKALDTLVGPSQPPHAGTRAEPASGAGVVILYGAEMGKRGVKAQTARPLTPQELTVDALNKCLSRVIDTRPLISLEGIPEEYRAAIREGRAVVGMDKKALFLALGEPKQKTTEIQGGDVIEKWLYEDENLKTRLVILKNGVAAEIKEF